MDAGEASAGRFPEAVLTDADDAPAPLAELAINTFIAGHAVFALRSQMARLVFGRV